MTQNQADPSSPSDLERFEHYYLVGPDGGLHFNRAGRARLAPWFAQHGFSLQACRTVEQLKTTLRAVLAEDLAQAQGQLQDLLASDDCSSAERQALAALLSRRTAGK